MNIKDSINQVIKHSDLDSDGFNEHLADIQDAIGVDDGGYASMWFSEKAEVWAKSNLKLRIKMICEYISNEILFELLD